MTRTLAATAVATPPLCYPWWHAKFAPLAAGPQIVVSSGCPLDKRGNIACPPERMRTDAERQLRRLAPEAFGGRLSLETYTLARYMQSEIGDGTIEERVAVGEAAVNRAKLERLPRGVLDLLLYRQKNPSHPNYGFYGPIHDTKEGCAARGLREFCAPFGRWASTRQDPTVLTLLLADLVMSGRSGNFARGADDQSDLFNRKAYPDPVATLRRWANEGRYWVGPLVGVDHRRTFLTRQYGYSPTSPLGIALLMRGIAAALDTKGPSWPPDLPICGDARETKTEVAKFLVAVAGLGGFVGLSWLALRVAKNLAIGVRA
jgi:hypothetical protein